MSIDDGATTCLQGQGKGRFRKDMDPAALTTIFIGAINFTIIRRDQSAFVLDME